MLAPFCDGGTLKLDWQQNLLCMTILCLGRSFEEILWNGKEAT